MRLKLPEGSSRRRLLAGLLVVVVVMATATFSSAKMTSRSQNSASLSAGTLVVSDSKAGQAIVNASGMRPGTVRQDTVNITNGGNVSGTLALTASGLTNTPSSPALSSVLDLQIERLTAPTGTVYSGKFGSFTSASLGAFSPGVTHTFRFTISWPAASDSPALQGAQTSQTFNWKASS